MVVGLKEKSGKKKERVSWGNVRSVTVCCGAPAGVNSERKITPILGKVPKLAFWPTRLQHNHDPISPLRSPI